MTVDLLRHVRVLDFGIWRPVPFATQLLAELGAEVTKVEPPGGDPMHMFPALYGSLNARKTILEHDLKDAVGQTAARALIAETDVVIEGFRPGVADRLGIGYEAVRAVNPSVIYCSISGYGQDGPLASTPGHDLNYQAWAGFLAARAPEVTRSGVPVGDLAGGAYAAMAICAAVAGRHRTGEGTHIDVSMADVLLSWAGPEIGGEFASSDDPGVAFPAYGTFPCRNGHITLGVVSEDTFWVALCTALGLDELAPFDVARRAGEGPLLRERIAQAIASHDRDELVRILVTAGVPVAPVLPANEALRSPHFLERGVSVTNDDGTVRLEHPVRFSR